MATGLTVPRSSSLNNIIANSQNNIKLEQQLKVSNPTAPKPTVTEQKKEEKSDFSFSQALILAASAGMLIMQGLLLTKKPQELNFDSITDLLNKQEANFNKILTDIEGYIKNNQNNSEKISVEILDAAKKAQENILKEAQEILNKVAGSSNTSQTEIQKAIEQNNKIATQNLENLVSLMQDMLSENKTSQEIVDKESEALLQLVEELSNGNKTFRKIIDALNKSIEKNSEINTQLQSNSSILTEKTHAIEKKSEQVISDLEKTLKEAQEEIQKLGEKASKKSKNTDIAELEFVNFKAINKTDKKPFDGIAEKKTKDGIRYELTFIDGTLAKSEKINSDDTVLSKKIYSNENFLNKDNKLNERRTVKIIDNSPVEKIQISTKNEGKTNTLSLMLKDAKSKTKKEEKLILTNNQGEKILFDGSKNKSRYVIIPPNGEKKIITKDTPMEMTSLGNNNQDNFEVFRIKKSIPKD